MNLTDDEKEIIGLLRRLSPEKVSMFKNDLSLVLTPRLEERTDGDFSFLVESAEKKKKPRRLEHIGKEKRGFLDWIGDLFTDEKEQLQKKKLQDYLVKNYDKYKGAQVVLKQNRDLAEYLSEALESGNLTPSSLTVFMELAARDPKWASKLELKLDPSKVELRAYLPAFVEYVKEDEWGMSSDALQKTLERHIKTHVQTINEYTIKVDSDPSEPEKREVVISGSIGDMLKIMSEFKIDPKKLLIPLL